ncbi:electron transfer flavoprotein subunit beta/FixA family protein [Effusibacillus dendaii]|uniref:Electron transfer flavoprotein subunit beta n=1 Tax=Effusibacillus dendaii TaxID=2743772 RepID=A0A7I8D9U3_9BACL|nr:electron transfer flavoprotein subunit beta/FixA family protein [Effusibacillus dendaii]BCJ86767.1 electron transfer flavoprotein subunit beta [Effusibacillus dendaii]
MNIFVLLKQTFDTEEQVIIENGKVVEDGVRFVINPYDEYAVEEAIQLTEEYGGEVTVVSVGPGRVEEALRTALAMGADKAVLVEDKACFGDEYTTSKVLATVIRNRPFDLILCGQMAVDDGAAQVGTRVAELLAIPHVATAVDLEIRNGTATIKRESEGNIEIIEANLPLLVTCQQGLNEPRYPSLPNKMKAKKKPLERLTVTNLQMEGMELAPKTEMLGVHMTPPKAPGRILQGDVREQVKELAHLLHDERRVV